jgi:hypothetical protein
MKRKSRKVERRIFKRLKIPIPLSMRFLGTTKHPQPINSKTSNVSVEGLSVKLHVILKNGSLLIQEGEEPIKLIPFLVLNEKMVGLDMKIPPEGENIGAIGRVIWYDFGSRRASYYFCAGIFLEKMGVKDRKKWEEFVKNNEVNHHNPKREFSMNQQACPKCGWVSGEKQYICPYCWAKLRESEDGEN